MAWDNTDYFFSGQGVILLGDRDLAGNPAGLIPVGNVSELKLTVATSVLEHKESKTGQRAIDLRLTTETKGTLSITIENFNATNLAAALRGTKTVKPGAPVVGELSKIYFGKIAPLNHMLISAVTVQRGANTLTPYTNDATAWDVRVNPESGSLLFNDGAVQALTTNATLGGVVPSAIVVGVTTQVTVANTAKAGDYVALAGFAGAGAALVNNKAHLVLSATPTGVVLQTNTFGATITIGVPLAVFDGAALTVGYTYATQNHVDPLVLGSPEKWMRFEGLNTADNNAPVVVDIFRFLSDPLKELSFISDTIQNFVLEGNMLADSGRTSGSKFFRQFMLR